MEIPYRKENFSSERVLVVLIKLFRYFFLGRVEVVLDCYGFDGSEIAMVKPGSICRMSNLWLSSKQRKVGFLLGNGGKLELEKCRLMRFEAPFHVSLK